MSEKYPPEILDKDDDNGTMPRSLDALTDAVVGHKIVSAEKVAAKNSWDFDEDLLLTLDNGSQVRVVSNGDCCAYTDVSEFLLHPESVDHVITGVGTTGGFTRWHIFADFGDIMELKVGWSCGNPFYYGYGFDIVVESA